MQLQATTQAGMTAAVHRPIRKVAICAPATPIRREVADRVLALAAQEYPEVELHFHAQCFVEEGHFAGPDEIRLAALLECANDPAMDAVWFAKGGYGSNRIAQAFVDHAGEAARTKTYCGYSDCGTLLGALYRNSIGHAVHAPMPCDIVRDGGEEAVRRVLAWFAGDDSGLEPGLGDTPAAAFNLYTLAMILGTPFMPDLRGHELLVEEVAEHEYAIDRLFFHVTAQIEGVAGIRLGEVTAIPENDRPFGSSVEEIAQDWCSRSGIAYLGRAQIGHTATNRIVPFGLEARRSRA